MYSLVSAAVLACDVARHPYALRLADTLDRVLALAPEETAALRDPAPDAVRRRVLASCQEPQRVSTALPAAARALGGSALATLDEALIGTLGDVHALVTREVPLEAAALQVVLDAVTVAWAGPRASLADAEGMRRPWEAAVSPVPHALPDTPYVARVRDLLEQVPRRTPAQWDRSVAAHRARRRLSWSEGMHLACRAAADAGRVLDVARAQLGAARALAVAHTGVSPYAAGMVVTAAVQAMCTADVVDVNTAVALRSAWEAGGPRQ